MSFAGPSLPRCIEGGHAGALGCALMLRHADCVLAVQLAWRSHPNAYGLRVVSRLCFRDYGIAWIELVVAWLVVLGCRLPLRLRIIN